MAAERGSGWLQRVWYGDAPGGFVLWPFEWLFRSVATLRRAAFRRGLATTRRVAAPVIVVGNIAVGGSGKTPLVGWLTREAQRVGHRPAIVSRGYGGSEPDTPLEITDKTSARVSGDEPLMLARETGVPVFVSRDRYAAAAQAVAHGADLVIADDGLQHYPLGRDAEIAVVDGNRRHGNGHCLPAGPLREPVSRLDDVDLVVYSNCDDDTVVAYQLALTDAVNFATGERRALSMFSGDAVHAAAGIGHPARFHKALAAFGIDVTPIEVPDHGRLGHAALHPSGDAPVFMTAKDAVKYEKLGQRHWVVPATVVLSEGAANAVRGTIELATTRYRERQGAAS